MPEYRIYSIDANERICGVLEIECNNDDEVIKAACTPERLLSPAEIWNLARLVARIEANGEVRAFDTTSSAR